MRVAILKPVLLSLEFLDRSSVSREGMPHFIMTGAKKVCTSFGDVLLRLFTGFRNTVTVPFLSSGGSVWVTMTAEAVVWITDLLMNGQQRILSEDLFTGHRGLVWKRP